MKNVCRLIILLFLCVLSSFLPVNAQTLSLEEAVHLALETYPTVAAQRSALAALRANRQVTRDNRLPNIRLHDQMTVGTANGMSGSYFSLGLIVPTSGARRETNQTDLATGHIGLVSMDWEVFNFGRFTAEQGLAEADVAVGEARLEGERFRLQQAVIGTFLDLIRLRQTLALEQRNVTRVDTVRRVIANLVRNGIKPGVDSSLAAVAFSKARMMYWQVLEEYRQAQVLLSTLTGRPLANLEIDTTLRTDRLTSPPGAGQELTASHPLLRLADRAILRQNAEMTLIQKSVLPRVSLLTAAWARGSSLNVSNQFGPLESGLAFSRSNYLLGIAATANLTDFRRRSNRTQMQRYRIQEASDQFAFQRLQLQNAITTSDSLLAVTRLRLAELPAALRSATAAYAQRVNLYNNGLENILALTDALQLLQSVEKDVLTTQDRALRLQLQRALATGNFDEFFTLFRR